MDFDLVLKHSSVWKRRLYLLWWMFVLEKKEILARTQQSEGGCHRKKYFFPLFFILFILFSSTGGNNTGNWGHQQRHHQRIEQRGRDGGRMASTTSTLTTLDHWATQTVLLNTLNDKYLVYMFYFVQLSHILLWDDLREQIKKFMFMNLLTCWRRLWSKRRGSTILVLKFNMCFVFVLSGSSKFPLCNENRGGEGTKKRVHFLCLHQACSRCTRGFEPQICGLAQAGNVRNM